MSDDAQAPANLFAAHQAFLRERLQTILATLHPALRADVERALAEKGKLLAHPRADASTLSPALPAGTWPLLTLLVAQHIAPDIDLTRAGKVALAVECFVCALDLLDDVEDEDQTPVVQELGTGRILNVSTALLALSQLSLLSLRQQKVPPALILRLLWAFDECTIGAVTGQHRDLLAEQRPAREFTREECIEIAAGKAGAIMRLACQSGAICAGASKKVMQQFAELGTTLGIAHQLDNDAHDLYHLLHHDFSPALDSGISSGQPKSDLARGKKTLPIVLSALSLADQPGREALANTFDADLKNFTELSDKIKEEYRDILNEGILATWGICLLYRERARERLQEIEVQRPVALELRLLLGFESSSGGT
ncbi:MAG TPA: polyprenyl synthetase family protein [Ktedonobacteraceae bacterium]|nr:polyprenyl synthetase family protein [Ktedonobacteraceae bacterium]